ncbi:to protein required for hyphal anastomosis [Geosmithia morbida]|uniref:To protein required for hyphal anastomosis n=1 Tax=Geosmithia morbida TaxID=1094350 RepID=A0A9P5CYP7_9HYPO|nr:to protein required for hyphal anastomosis [Geosmithia morbida]KAF4119627.1 to protein required for hyphal anastomosis [Geosmithia morbida]
MADTGPVASDIGTAATVDQPPVPDPPSSSSAFPPPPSSSSSSSSSSSISAPTSERAVQQDDGSPTSLPASTAVEAAPTDSLTLLQLRRMMTELHGTEPLAYDFMYTDTAPHAEEIDEWFTYQFWQWVRLNSAQRAFERDWEDESGADSAAAAAAGEPAATRTRTRTWEAAGDEVRARFVRTAVSGVRSDDAATRSTSIGKLLYLVLGRWGDTAMPNTPVDDCRSVASVPQLEAIRDGVRWLADMDGLPVVWEALRNNFEMQWAGVDAQDATPQETNAELMNLMTIMYMSVQQAYTAAGEVSSRPQYVADVNEKLLDLNPSLVDFMMTATAKLRWDEQGAMPQTQIFLLFWKSILLVFGTLEDQRTIKMLTGERDFLDDPNTGKITASPIDYHVFRQEITSKYPAYVPPRPAIPLEDENTSILPPLPNQTTTRSSISSGVLPGPPNAQAGGASILNQPVHIATPAPSPPPSPGVGGKGGKKQNYQTNQNFPFMYPPLDATSNSAGGKGMAGIHEALIGRRWEGSDIPASILEAGELFSSRVKMSRATRQLWEEREKFLRYERGWDGNDDGGEGGRNGNGAGNGGSDDGDDDIDSLDLDELTLEEKEALREFKAEFKGAKTEPRPPPPADAGPDFGPRPERLSDHQKRRLVAVEDFYRQALPHLQSLVIVLLRPILANVTSIVAQQSAAAQAAQQGGQGQGVGGSGGPLSGRGVMGGGGIPMRQSAAQDSQGQSPQSESQEPSIEEIDAARTREITSKAMTGILLLLLKWLKVSHVLKFEYLSQLLLDSNYLPLVLKLFAHQDIQQVIDSKTDRSEHSFFHFCNLGSKLKDPTRGEPKTQSREAREGGGGEVEDDDEDAKRPGEEEEEEEEESEDEAAPPPIRKQRVVVPPVPEPGTSSLRFDGAVSGGQGMLRPEVDELGYPTTSPPEEPITDFSRRNFFSLINYLRIMQKMCKKKAHRNLLMVQYKSSTIIRKSLKMPQPELRLYTLKLFKNQVPYCGRKWRQGNMRVITAVYLHCRPELREEWLAGSDIDAEVDSALPLEQALRSLTHWFNLRRYPAGIAPGIRVAMRDEQDFFTRELDKLDVNWAEMAAQDMDDGY